MTGEWRLASLSRLPLAELERLRDQCEAERGGGFIIWGKTRQTIIASLEAARAAFWDEKARSAPSAPQASTAAASTPRGGRCIDPDMLTAEECNEFLRGLPPVPLWGEEAK